jgi:hypothetical protein
VSSRAIVAALGRVLLGQIAVTGRGVSSMFSGLEVNLQPTKTAK